MKKDDIVIWYRFYLMTGDSIDKMFKPLVHSSYSSWVDEFEEVWEELSGKNQDWDIVDYDYLSDSDAWGMLEKEDVWDGWNDIFDIAGEYGIGVEALTKYLKGMGYGIEQAKEVMENAYEGEHGNMQDFAQYIVDEQLYNPDYYEWSFDYEHFGKELSWDIDNMLSDWDYSHEEAEEITNMRDEDLAEWYIEMLGGFEQLGKETIAQYQDVKKIERNLDAEGYYEIDGHIFRPY